MVGRLCLQIGLYELQIGICCYENRTDLRPVQVTAVQAIPAGSAFGLITIELLCDVPAPVLSNENNSSPRHGTSKPHGFSRRTNDFILYCVGERTHRIRYIQFEDLPVLGQPIGDGCQNLAGPAIHLSRAASFCAGQPPSRPEREESIFSGLCRQRLPQFQIVWFRHFLPSSPYSIG